MSKNQQNKITLVLGGARSGKSAFAEGLTQTHGLTKTYVATAEIRDDEMAKRVDDHQQRRDNSWKTCEVPLALADFVTTIKPDNVALVDCLTLWLSNVLLAERNVDTEISSLLSSLKNCKGHIVLVSNEVGMGIVPDNPLARNFRDAQGALNQKIARIAGLVVFVAAGLPMTLKGQIPDAKP